MGNTERKRVNPGDRRTSAMTENYKQIDATRTNANPLTMLQRKQNDLKVVSDQIKNREPFSYNINGDALYDQYKNQYKQRAEAASSDAIGKASAMTGGYGNSYAQMLGQQAYANEMAQFGEKENQLYQAAMDRYDRETNQLLNKYNMLSSEVDKEMAHEQALADAEVQKAKYTADQHQTLAGTLDWLEKNGYIDTTEADAIFAKYNGKDPKDDPEKVAFALQKNANGGYDHLSYVDAAIEAIRNNPDINLKKYGFNVTDQGEGNFLGMGINRDAKIKFNNGEFNADEISLVDLRRYLKETRNYSNAEANKIINDIAKNLGIET